MSTIKYTGLSSFTKKHTLLVKMPAIVTGKNIRTKENCKFQGLLRHICKRGLTHSHRNQMTFFNRWIFVQAKMYIVCMVCKLSSETCILCTFLILNSKHHCILISFFLKKRMDWHIIAFQVLSQFRKCKLGLLLGNVNWQMFFYPWPVIIKEKRLAQSY